MMTSRKTKTELEKELKKVRGWLREAKDDAEAAKVKHQNEMTFAVEQYNSLHKKYGELQQLSSDASMERNQIKKDRDLYRRLLERIA